MSYERFVCGFVREYTTPLSSMYILLTAATGSAHFGGHRRTVPWTEGDIPTGLTPGPFIILSYLLSSEETFCYMRNQVMPMCCLWGRLQA